MENIMKRTPFLVVSSLILLTIVGCDQSSSKQPGDVGLVDPIDPPNAWLLTSEPSGAVSITEAKESAKEGDQVVIRGRIGGRHSPMSEESSVFTIMDMELAYCGQHEDDGCPTPWDYCCETPDTIGTNSATVQVVGNGAIDPVGAGLKPLDVVILVGTVGPRPNDQVLTIQATGVYRDEG